MLIHPEIQQWQTLRHEVGIVAFCPADIALSRFPHPSREGFIPIGIAECELLCVDSLTGEVLLFDHEVADLIYCRCASSQMQFMEALRILEEHFTKCVASEDYWNDEAAGLDVIARATGAAGGPQYAAMYRSMVGR